MSLPQIDPMFYGGVEVPAAYSGGHGIDQLDMAHSPAFAALNVSALEKKLMMNGEMPKLNAVMDNWPTDIAIGPMTFFAGGVGLMVWHLVMVDERYNLSDPSMGLPYRPSWEACTKCHAIAPPGQQLWGSVSTNIRLDALINGTDQDFGKLRERGYEYTLWHGGEFAIQQNVSIARAEITNWTSKVTDRLKPITIPFTLINGNTW